MSFWKALNRWEAVPIGFLWTWWYENNDIDQERVRYWRISLEFVIVTEKSLLISFIFEILFLPINQFIDILHAIKSIKRHWNLEVIHNAKCIDEQSQYSLKYGHVRYVDRLNERWRKEILQNISIYKSGMDIER